MSGFKSAKLDEQIEAILGTLGLHGLHLDRPKPFGKVNPTSQDIETREILWELMKDSLQDLVDAMCSKAYRMGMVEAAEIIEGNLRTGDGINKEAGLHLMKNAQKEIDRIKELKNSLQPTPTPEKGEGHE